jgi:adenylylsulfate kinase
MASDTGAFAVWMTGLPASGKSTIARALAGELERRGVRAAVLESDALRPVLTPHATYTDDDRAAFYRAMTHVGKLLVDHGVPVIFDATANRRIYRDRARSIITRFVEVYVDCPREVCASRDPKGLYRQAASGGTATLPGVQAAYEPPLQSEVVVSGDRQSPQSAALAIMRVLEARGDIPPDVRPRAPGADPTPA